MPQRKFRARPSCPCQTGDHDSCDGQDQRRGQSQIGVQVKSEHFERDTTCDERERGPNPRQERALVRERESCVRFVTVPIHEAGKARSTAHSATVRKPALPIDESGVLLERAELRYRLQYEI